MGESCESRQKGINRTTMTIPNRLKKSLRAIVVVGCPQGAMVTHASMPEAVKASLNRMVGQWVLSTELGDRTVTESITFESSILS